MWDHSGHPAGSERVHFYTVKLLWIVTPKLSIENDLWSLLAELCTEIQKVLADQSQNHRRILPNKLML